MLELILSFRRCSQRIEVLHTDHAQAASLSTSGVGKIRPAGWIWPTTQFNLACGCLPTNCTLSSPHASLPASYVEGPSPARPTCRFQVMLLLPLLQPLEDLLEFPSIQQLFLISLLQCSLWAGGREFAAGQEREVWDWGWWEHGVYARQECGA